MDNKYNVDDILNEIKRRKSAKLAEEEADVSAYSPRKPEPEPDAEKPEAYKEPESVEPERKEPESIVEPEPEKRAAGPAVREEPEQRERVSRPASEDFYVPDAEPLKERRRETYTTYTDEYRNEPMDSRRIQIDDTLKDFFSIKDDDDGRRNKKAKKPQQESERKRGGFVVVSEPEEDDDDGYQPMHSAESAAAAEHARGEELAGSYDELQRQRSDKVNKFSLEADWDKNTDHTLVMPSGDGEKKISEPRRSEIKETPSTTRAREEFEKRRPAPEEDEDDFSSEQKKEELTKDLWDQRNSLIIRLIVAGALCLLLVLLSLNASGVLTLPSAIDFGDGGNSLFYIVNILIMCVAVMVCHVPVGGGLLALFKMKANGDSLVAVSLVASVIHAVSMVVFSERIIVKPGNIYFWIPMLALVFNTIGKLSMLERISGNFDLVSVDGEKAAVALEEDPDLHKRMTGVHKDAQGKVAGISAVKRLSHFFELSFDDDFADNIYRSAAPIAVVAALLVAVVLYIARKDLFLSMTAFAAITVMAAPLTSTLAVALPLSSTCTSLRKENAMLAGYSAAEEISETDVVLMDDTDIFRPGDIELHAIKTFSRGRVDEALIDAASVICQDKNTLRFIFDKVISGNAALLKNYDTLVYEDGMGLSAWVNSKRVLIGNRMLMEHHSIETPNIEYEQKYLSAGQKVIYLSSSGELTAMFVLSYKASKESAEMMDILNRRKATVAVRSTDPNVTSGMLAELFGFPEERINIVSSKYQSDFDSVVAPREKLPAKALTDGTPLSLARVIDAAASVKGKASRAVMLQLVGIVIGCALITFFAFIGAMSSMNSLFLLIYKLVWLVVVAAAGTLKLK